mmetsp:Transcript_29902/g.27373  ORF Transcript_29902/g.27373 Transcript_29902/m.27373 type:complete len:133 (+) Transcript_29902:1047-1445(+)
MDPALHVRISLAKGIQKLAQYLPQDLVIKKLFPLISTLLRDEFLEVKSEAFDCLKAFCSILDHEHVEKSVVPMITNVSNEKQWRCRLAMIEKLPQICERLGYEIFSKDIGTFAFNCINDHFYLIREQTIDNI